jgi:hypothetical protein
MSRLPALSLGNVREVYDGRDRLGTIRRKSDVYEARDADETLIGGFASYGEAFSAIVSAGRL